ncbi:hypothetical protein [Enterococcus sp. AZ180]|uniref:hypothetical protein n=1 Tax=Enterococcus sp. AZ180 TaxID=2774961 RepID=UPI003F26FE8B
MPEIKVVRKCVRNRKVKNDKILYDLGLAIYDRSLDSKSCIIKSKCSSCEKDIYRDFSLISGRAKKYILKCISENKDYVSYCSISCSNRNQKEYKECSSCKKVAIHYKRSVCMDCYNKSELMKEASLKSNKNQWSFNEKGVCSSCKNESDLNIYGYCFSCRIDGWGFSTRFCNECNDNTFHNGYYCVKCSEMKIGSAFNRESFYSSKLEKLKISFKEKPVSIESIDPYAGIPGVWAIFGEDLSGSRICLDVCQTKDIGSEMLGWIRQANACKGKTDEEISKLNEKYSSYNRIKKRNIMNHKNISFVIVKEKELDFISRENIELAYACKTRAKYWSPAPGQIARVAEWVG